MADFAQLSAPKTVLFLDHTAKISGGEVALLNLVAALDHTRYVPVVVLASDGPLAAKLRTAGIETHVLPLDPALVETRKETLGFRAILRLGGLVRLAFYACRLARWARRRGVDVIHTNSLKSDVYGGLAGRLARVPVVWHVRDRIGEGYLPGPAAVLFRRLAHLLPQVVITNSESTRRCLISSARAADTHGRGEAVDSRVQVVHDGYDPTVFTNIPCRNDALNSGPVISLVGRLAPWKGQHVFIDAAASVLTRFPQTRFWIVGSALFGENEYERQVRAQVAALGVEKQVEFLGFQEDVPAVLGRTDIVVHASTHGEPFGQVVVEGMAAGKPVVATDGGALPEIVENGITGLLTPMGDAEALADALCALLADPARAQALGEAGRQHAHDRFTVARTAAKVEAVYDSLFKQKRPVHSAAVLGIS